MLPTYHNRLGLVVRLAATRVLVAVASASRVPVAAAVVSATLRVVSSASSSSTGIVGVGREGKSSLADFGALPVVGFAALVARVAICRASSLFVVWRVALVAFPELGDCGPALAEPGWPWILSMGMTEVGLSPSFELSSCFPCSVATMLDIPQSSAV